MPISIACPHCDWKGRVKDELAGRKGKCPTCGELIPIPLKGSPPPVPAGQRPAVDDAPDVVDDADIVEDEAQPKSKPGGRPAPVSKGRRDEDDERLRRRRDEEDDDRPSKARRRAADDDEEDRPSKSRRRWQEDDEDEDDRPRKKRRTADYDNDRPRKKRKGGKVRRREGGGSSKKIGAIVGGAICLLIGLGLLGLGIVLHSTNFWGIGLCVIGILSLIRGFAMSGDDD